MSTSVLTTPVPADLTVVPVDRGRWPADPGQYLPNAYIRVTLDLAAGQAAILADPFRRGPEKNDRTLQKYPGSYVHHWDFPVPVPGHMTWEIGQHLTPDEAEQLLELIAEQARVILRELVPVEGRAAGGFDWSLRAAAAVRVIDSFALNPWHALSETSVTDAAWTIEHYYEFRGLLDMTDALAATPELGSPEWAVMTDAELDEAAARLARSAPWDLREKWLDAAHLQNSRPPGSTPIYLVGVLATLYRLRAEQAGALVPADASAWFAARTTRLAVVDDCTDDAELAQLAQAEERHAAAAGKLLLGAPAYLAAIRAGHRDRVRQELVATGRRAADIAGTYKKIRSSRAALLLRVDGWGDPQDGDETNRNALLARLAGISRQAVLSLRERALAVNAADTDDREV
ncbi:hypothetical protein [Amycolatopsis sp. NPDC004079]|uniref:hypothetical protein n=1 Tax=Amycolatopsis sp. NPDC004079 TaxID=3154549 RepID=UPI0033A1930E